MSIYLDTSVVVSLFVLDAFTDRAKKHLNTQPELVVSDFGVAEFASALARRVRMQMLRLDEAYTALAMFDEWEKQWALRVEIDPADIRAVELILRRLDLPLRAPDALHIVVAQRLGADLATFDEKMATCAGALGAPVVAL